MSSDFMEFLIYIVLIFIAYFLPSCVADCRRHHQRHAICVLNLFLGWTVLGWIAALIWASTAVVKPTISAPAIAK